MTEVETRELVERHVESLYALDEDGRMAAINDAEGAAPPRLALVRSSAGVRCILARGLPRELSEDLTALAAGEPAADAASPWPRQRARYRALLEAHAPVAREYAGPAFVLPRPTCDADNPARLLGDADRPLLAAHFAWLESEWADAEPVAGVLAHGAVVSVCRCARLRTAAVEAGVETAPAYRGRGFARQATARWAEAIYAAGMRPLYSTSWGNTASLRIAAALAAERYAVDYSLA